jgi:hypothetical protein|tara:strand:+ start:434 stop:1177 length:744 start_codon:yes stop_codon:yes gene_type:complete
MKKKFCLILTATIDPKGMTFLARSNVQDRYKDYFKAFNSWCLDTNINDIIFLENSGFDLESFINIKKQFPEKKIEIISSQVNNDFPRELGKGYGEYLSLNEIFKNSKIINNYDFIIAVSGRHYVKNMKSIIKEVEDDQKDIKVCLKDNLSFADTNLYAGSFKFFKEILLDHVKNTNDTKGIYFEHCVAKATLTAINKGYLFSQLSVYPDIYGYIGTNNKLLNYNIIKKFKLFLFGKIKKYFFSHKKY